MNYFLIEAPLRLWPRPPPGTADGAPSPDGGGRRGQRRLQRPTRQRRRRGQHGRPPPHHLGRVREGRRQAEAADRGQHLPASRAAGGEEQPGMGERNSLLSCNFLFPHDFFLSGRHRLPALRAPPAAAPSSPARPAEMHQPRLLHLLPNLSRRLLLLLLRQQAAILALG